MGQSAAKLRMEKVQRLGNAVGSSEPKRGASLWDGDIVFSAWRHADASKDAGGPQRSPLKVGNLSIEQGITRTSGTAGVVSLNNSVASVVKQATVDAAAIKQVASSWE
jgi:hypothetical protein